MEEEIDIKDILLALWRKKIIVIFVTCVFFVIGILFYGKKTNNNGEEKYRNSINIENSSLYYVETDFMLSRGNSTEIDDLKTSYKVTIDAGAIANLNSFAKSENFLNSILKDMKKNKKINASDMKNNIAVLGDGTSDILTLVVAYSDKEEAKSLSTIILREIASKAKKIYEIDEIVLIDGPRVLNKEEFNELEIKVNNTEELANQASISNGVKNNTVNTKKKVVLITAIGFVLVCGVIVAIELLNVSVKDDEQLEKVTKSKTLVKIPKSKLDLSDKFELLIAKLDSYSKILITSSEIGDGKTFVATNLAKAYEKIGKKVLLTDVTKLMEDNPEEKIKELEKKYDMIIIDSENILESAKTIMIAKIVKNTMLVASEGVTSIDNIVKAKSNVEDAGGNIIGNVLNKTSRK